ncbi:MAG: pyrophosphokinae [Deinococcus sp.]|nr:pyrophosphokinae [Deinococcus sp.]
MNDDLLRAYREALPDYEALRDAAVAHTTRLLTAAGLNIHHITGRVKRAGSLEDKLRRKAGRYESLDDVTDLVAVRVITYFESDVGVVSRLIEKHHEVDWNHSIDKSKMHDPDRFGYMGVHYVVRVPEGGLQGGGLEVSGRLAGARFEVQIRSILQHAWAEIEHDLGYKNRDAVPREVRRRFYRLAGLLEMADEEFMALHRMTRDYAATLPERVAATPDDVFIDAQSMTHLLTLPPVHDLDTAVARALGVRLLSHWSDPERPQRLASLLHYVGVRSVGLLHKELKRNEDEITRFAAALMPRLRQAWTPAGGARPGTSVVHYALLRACSNASLEPGEVVTLLDLSGANNEAQMVQAVREVYQEVTGTPPAILAPPAATTG